MCELLKKMRNEIEDDAMNVSNVEHPLANELQAFRAERPDAPVTEFYDWHHDDSAATACEQAEWPVSAKRAKPSE